MSLFKAREWWSTVSGYEEFHDLGCLAVGNLDNSSPGLDKVVVGSFQGLVRIYEPRPPGFSPDHVILEKQFPSPVLQVAIGKFIQTLVLTNYKGSPNLYLAVLHPRELMVCTLTSEKTDDDSLVYLLTPVYKHSLQRTACNMTWGSFGGVKDHDYICVQSMDGQLSFYNQECQTFSCFLPDFLIPGSLTYLPRTDSLVTVNSAHTLQVFRYQTLSVAGSGTMGAAATRDAGKKFTADWSANLGENVIDICVAMCSTGRTQILVLGERSLFSFKDNGILRFMKKLDFNPSCFHGYSTTPPQEDADCGSVGYLVATHSNQLLVFKDTSLLWAASLDHTPVDITTGTFRELNGVVIALDELGHLTCSYMGTDPTLFAAGTRGQRNVNYEEMDREMSELNHIIKTSQKGGLSTDGGQATLVIESQIDEEDVRIVQLEEEESHDRQTSEGEPPIKKCVEVKLLVRSSSGPTLTHLTVSVDSSLPLTTHPSHFTLTEVSSTHAPEPLVVTVVATPTLLPTSTHLTVSATFTSTEGMPQVLRHHVELPVHLFCQPAFPDKTAAHKVTIDVNHYVKDFDKLFPSQLILPSAPNNAIGLTFLNSTKLTIVASPSSSRYRLQSDSLSALGVGLNILMAMLRGHFPGENPPFRAAFTPPLPLTEYFEIIERHYRLRANIDHCKDWLSRHSQQFRSIQKRLLTRFKDKTPVGLAHLDTLLDGTYMQLMALAEKNELFQLELQECSNQLACATLLINTLLKLATSMSEEDYNVLSSSLSAHVTMDTEEGWEERTDAAVTHLLRTTLSKSQKEQSVNLSTVEMPSESSKIKKHIALLCDRILKGWMPANGRNEATQSLSNSEQTDPPTNTSQTPSQGTAGSKVTRGKLKPRPSVLPPLPEVREVTEGGVAEDITS